MAAWCVRGVGWRGLVPSMAWRAWRGVGWSGVAWRGLVPSMAWRAWRGVGWSGVAWRGLVPSMAWRAWRGVGWSGVAWRGLVPSMAWRALGGVRWVAWRCLRGEKRVRVGGFGVASRQRGGAVRAYARRTPSARAGAGLRPQHGRRAVGSSFGRGVRAGGRIGGHRRGVGCDAGFRIIGDFHARAEPRHASKKPRTTNRTPSRIDNRMDTFTWFRKPQKTARMMVAMTKRQHEKLAEAAEQARLCKADYLVALAVAQWDADEPDAEKRWWYGGATKAEQEAEEAARRQAAAEAVRARQAALGVGQAATAS